VRRHYAQPIDCLRNGCVAVGVEVVAVEAHQCDRFRRGDADAVVDHESGQLDAVYEDHARGHVVRIVAGAAGEGRGSDEDAFGRPLAVQRPEEPLDLRTSDGAAHFLACT